METPKSPTSVDRSTLAVTRYVRDALKPNIPLGKQQESLIGDFCQQSGISADLTKGLVRLVTKFDRMRKPQDVESILNFALWLKSHAPQNFYSDTNLIYLSDERMPLRDVIENMKANYTFWTRMCGDKIFQKSPDTIALREGIWKSWLPLPGYYLSLKGGSGSGTFSVDIAIGFDHKHTEHELPIHDTAGEIWRVGFDIELGPGGEKIFRLIRTGSGHKSGGDENRAADLKSIRSNFLNEYKSSPQRLLLFLALEVAYSLGFDHVKALSTEGALRISSLGKSSTHLDYSTSFTDVGFDPRAGDWHEIRDLQHAMYNDLPIMGSAAKHETRGLDVVVRAFNSLRHAEGDTLPLKIADENDPSNLDLQRLEKIWSAYHRLHKNTQADSADTFDNGTEGK